MDGDKKIRVKSVIIQLLFFAVLIFISFLVFKPIKRELDHRLESIKGEIIYLIESNLNRRIAYSGISPSFLQTIVIRDLKILEQDRSDTLLTIKKLRIRYNLLDIIFNRPGDAIKTIYIENTYLSFDIERDRDLLELIESMLYPPQSEETRAGIAAPGVSLAANNLTLDIITPEGLFGVSKLHFKIDPEGEHFAIRLRSNIDAEFAHELFNMTEISSSVQFNGQVDTQFNWVDVRAQFNALKSNIFQVKEQRFHITYENSRLDLRKIEDKLPVDLFISYFFKESLTTIEFKTQDFFASDIITLSSDLAYINPWLTSMLTADGVCVLGGETDGPIFYQADIEALIDNEHTAGSYFIRGNLSGNTENVHCTDVLVSFNRGKVIFDGDIPLDTLYPTGTVVLKDFKIDEDLRLNTEFNIASSGKRVDVESRNIDIAGQNILNLEATVYPESLPLQFEAGFSLPGEDNRIEISGSYDSQTTGEVIAGFSLERVPSPRLYSLARAVYPDLVLPEGDLFKKAYRISTSGNVKTDMYAFDLDLPAFHIEETGPVSRSLEFSALGDNSGFSFKNVHITWDEIMLQGRLDLAFGPKGRLDFSTTIRYLENEYAADGSFNPGDRLILHGSHDLYANIDLSQEDGSLPFAIKAEDFPFIINEEKTRISIDSTGFFTDPRDWQVELAHLEVVDFPFLPADIPLTETSMAARGVVTPNRAGFDYLRFSDSLSILEGSGSGDYDLAEGSIDHGSIVLKGEADESYQADFSISKESFDIKIEFNASPLERVEIKAIRGALSGIITITGPPESPDISVDFNVENGYLGNDAIDVAGRGSIIESEIQLAALDIRYLQSTLSNSSAVYNLETGNAAFYGTFDGSFRQKPINLDLSLNARIEGEITRENLFNLAHADFTADMYIDGLEISGIENQPWLLDIARKSEIVEVSGGPENSIFARIDPEGSFEVVLQQPMPIACEAEGFIENQVIEAELNKIELSLESIAILINLGYVEFRKGTAEGGLRIVGPINDPDIFGTISAKDVTAGIPLTQDQIGPTKVSLFFEGKTMNIKKINVPVGTGAATVGGTFIIDHWLPQEFQLTVSSAPDEGLHIYQLLGPLFADGIATGEVTITQSGTHTAVAGNAVLQGCNITLGEEVYYASSDSDYSYSIDITITTGKRVEFFWPSETVPVLRSTVEPGHDVKIFYDSTFEDYAVKGDVEIRGGEILYFERSFYIREGKIGFNEDQDSFDPTLTVRSELRETWQDEPVRIYLTADENRFSEFEPRFESDPPMDNITLFSILGQSIVAQLGGEALNVTSALVFTGDLITQFGIIRNVEQSLRDTLNLDLFTLRSPVFQNVMQSFVTDSTLPLDNDIPSLGKYLDKTTMLLGKYLGTDLFLELMVQLSALEPYEYELRRVRGIDVYSELSLEWKTPFFLMEWSFFPTHPENLFLTDNRLSLSWKYSY